MTTALLPRRRTARKSRPAPALPASTRPVPELLRELAYHLHTTRAVGRRPEAPAAAPTRSA
jgi:hypothetical protein